MIRLRPAATTIPFLALALASCADASSLPTALDPPVARFVSVPGMTDRLGDAVLTSSAISGTAPAEQGIGLPPLSALLGGQLSGTVVHIGRGCASDPYLANPAGAIALMERGDCPFTDKVQRARDEGAIGVVVYNSAGENDELVRGWLVFPEVDIPGVFVQRSTGILLRDSEAPVTVVIRPAITENLAYGVALLAAAGALPDGRVTSLSMVLQAVQRHVEQGRFNGALGALNAFVAQVDGLVAEGTLSEDWGRVFTQAAQALIASLTS